MHDETHPYEVYWELKERMVDAMEEGERMRLINSLRGGRRRRIRWRPARLTLGRLTALLLPPR